MKMKEIMENASVGSTSSGSIAPVSQALGMQSRSGGSMLSGKYVTDSDPTPNTPSWMKKLKKKAPNVSR